MTKPTSRRRQRRSKPLSRTHLAAFELIRLSRRWSYRKLAEEVARVCEVPMPEPTLVKALRGGRVLDTTSYPLLQYLAQQDSDRRSA